MITVALVGPDGAGKSTISARLAHEVLPGPLRTIYMGVNLSESTVLLPTTRLVLALKRSRGTLADTGHPDASGGPRVARPSGGARGAVRAGLTGLRTTMWLAEEWYRQAVAWRWRRQGAVVVFDRHFYADYYHYDVSAGAPRTRSARVHGWLLEHAYPKPDLVIVLDAPGEVLFSRKGEGTPEWLEQRRQQYRELEHLVPGFAVVDVDRPVDDVVADVVAAIRSACDRASAR